MSVSFINADNIEEHKELIKPKKEFTVRRCLNLGLADKSIISWCYESLKQTVYDKKHKVVQYLKYGFSYDWYIDNVFKAYDKVQYYLEKIYEHKTYYGVNMECNNWYIGQTWDLNLRFNQHAISEHGNADWKATALTPIWFVDDPYAADAVERGIIRRCDFNLGADPRFGRFSNSIRYKNQTVPKCAATRIKENRRIYFYIAFNERGVAEFLRDTLGAEVYTH